MAAIGEQILGPTDVSLSNWTVRPSSGCSVVLATHTAGVSVDGYTLTLAANLWNIVRTYNLTPGRELLFACRYRLGTASNFVVHMSKADNVYDPLYGSFVGDQGAWSTAKMYFTVPPNGVAKLHFGAHFQALGLPNQTAGTVDVYGLQILGRNPGDRQPSTSRTISRLTACLRVCLRYSSIQRRFLLSRSRSSRHRVSSRSSSSSCAMRCRWCKRSASSSASSRGRL